MRPISSTTMPRTILARSALLTLAALANPACAKEEGPARNYRTIWLIEPTDAPAGKLVLGEGALIIQQRLLPLAMVTLSEDYVAAKPEESLAKGTQLVLADGAEKAVFCSTKYKRPGTLTQILSIGPETGTQRCFVDADNDGKFDQTFVGFNNLQTLPSVFGRLPKNPIPVLPLAYKNARSADFAEKYYVGIQYIRQSGVGKKRRFQLVYGAGKPWGTFSFDDIINPLETKRETDLPKKISRLGAVITILGGGKGMVEYQVDAMMPAQPFGVVVSTSTY